MRRLGAGILRSYLILGVVVAGAGGLLVESAMSRGNRENVNMAAPV